MASLVDWIGAAWRSALSQVNLKTIVVLYILFNMKSLHFMWHFRFIKILIRRLTDPADKHLSPRCLFLPAITSTRSPLLECDYNIHKSNSTYFSDLDMSRGHLTLVLFRRLFNPLPGPNQRIAVLSGVQCVYRKEIKPYEPYEIWTRVLTWDDKWLYVVSHFVEKGRYVHKEYLMQPGSRLPKRRKNLQPKAPLKAVYASCVSRYVFKHARKTLPPQDVLRECGLLPKEGSSEGGMSLEEIDAVRQKCLPIAKLEDGWDAVHELFEGDETAALGRYTDLFWK